MKIKIDEIIIGSRARKDLGDLQELADSIKENGLLQPIAIDAEGFLIDGQRRIEAVKLLGWTEIEAHKLTINDQLNTEFYKNELRKSFTLSERLTFAEKLEHVVKARSRRKMYEAGKYGSLGGRGNKKLLGKSLAAISRKGVASRDVIAKMVGISPNTLRKVKEIVNAKENPEYKDLIEKMDQADEVESAYQELKKRKSKICEINELPKGTKLKIVSMILEMPNGSKKEMRISNDWFKNKNLLAWIMENIELGIDQEDTVINKI